MERIKKPIHSWALRFFLNYAVILGALTSIAALLSIKTTLSFFLGAMSHYIPSLIMALFAFKNVGATNSKKVVTGFFLGEAIKFILIIAFVLLTMLFFAINAYAFIIGLFSSICGFVVATSITDKYKTDKKYGSTNKL
ncbi:MAG: hypothetical protein HON55_01925 [Legionellales bacterium]|jgi:ATP synthase protein I|nr:hypothetical protein [Legionellales bacterium]